MNGHRVPFRCYFCNLEIEDEGQQNHMSACGAVLEPCPNKCGSYIARNTKGRHLQVCQNRVNRRSWTDAPQQYYNGGSSMPSRKVSESSVNLSTLSSVSSQSTAVLKDLHLKLNELTARHAMFAQEQKNETHRANSTLQKLQAQSQNLSEWRKYIQYQFENVGKELRVLELLRRDRDVLGDKLIGVGKEVDGVKLALNAHKVAFKDEQMQTRQTTQDINEQIQTMKDKYHQDNAVVAALWDDQKKRIDKIVDEATAVEKDVHELREKLANLSFEVRTSNELIADCLEQIKRQDGVIEEMRSSLTQTRLDVELAEDSFSNIQGLISTSPGRIIWKITDFSSKLEQTKKQDRTPLKGPIFYTNDYGYKVRLLVYLNGLKKWKGRYLLACLHVLKGDYDDLQKWPCRIEANVILKDLENHDNPKDYVRYITAKREFPNDEAEEPQESSTQYIFIPHATLTKEQHLKNDTFYLEIVTSKQRQKDETHI